MCLALSLSLSLLTSRPPPISTLFPYTTLFRSGRRGVPVAIFGHAGDGHVHVNALPDVTTPGWREALGGLYGDRKSTRLNSSHANISYAVFCLKKKNAA